MQSPSTFKSLELHPDLQAGLAKCSFKALTPTQVAALPPALQGNDILCLAQTGSGKTLCYLIPYFNHLLNNSSGLCLVLVPTRQLAVQVKQVAQKLGAGFGTKLQAALLIGGVNQMDQVIQLARKPNLIVGCPGRVLDHIKGTKGFRLDKLTHLVLDEVDKLIGHEHIKLVQEVLRGLPTRTTLMYSATINRQVMKLEKLATKKAKYVEVTANYKVPSTLSQTELVVQAKYRDCLLYHLLSSLKVKTIVFFQSCEAASRLARVLAYLELPSHPLTGKMAQDQRQASVREFAQSQSVLCTTDVAARGLDFLQVACVINYDVPDPQNYIHRVGRTARNGLQGVAITLVTEYSIDLMAELSQKVQGITEQQFDEQLINSYYERVTKANHEVRPARVLSQDEQYQSDSDRVCKKKK